MQLWAGHGELVGENSIFHRKPSENDWNAYIMTAPETLGVTFLFSCVHLWSMVYLCSGVRNPSSLTGGYQVLPCADVWQRDVLRKSCHVTQFSHIHTSPGNYFRAAVTCIMWWHSYTTLWRPFLTLLSISWVGEIVVILVIVVIQDASFCTLCTVKWGETLYRPCTLTLLGSFTLVMFFPSPRLDLTFIQLQKLTTFKIGI